MSGIDAARGVKGIRLRLGLRSSCIYRRLTKCPIVPFFSFFFSLSWLPRKTFLASCGWAMSQESSGSPWGPWYLVTIFRGAVQWRPWVFVCDTAELTAPWWSHSSAMLSKPGLQEKRKYISEKNDILLSSPSLSPSPPAPVQRNGHLTLAFG